MASRSRKFLKENWIHFLKNWTLWKLSFQDLSLFKTLSSKWNILFKDVIVACLYAVSNSGQVNTYQQREKQTRELLWDKKSQNKNLISITKQKHSLNIMKPSNHKMLENLQWKDFSRPVSYWNRDISYNYNFNLKWNLGIMLWNLNAYKTLDFKTPEKWTFHLNEL